MHLVNFTTEIESGHLDSVRNLKGRPRLSFDSIDEMYGRHAKILCQTNGAVLTASAPSIRLTGLASRVSAA